MLNQNHSYSPRAATYHFLNIPQVKTPHFRQYSVKFQASEIWNKFQRTQNLNLLPSAPCEFKKHYFRHILPNTAITPRAIYHSLYIAIFYFIIFFFFMSLMPSLLVTHILDYQYDNYLVKYIDYYYCSYFYCYFDHYSCCKCYYCYLFIFFLFSMLLITFRDVLQFY